MSLGYRHIVPVNQTSGVYIVPEVRVVHRLARVTLHRRDIIPVNKTARINIAKQDRHRNRYVRSRGVIVYRDEGNLNRLRVGYTGDFYKDLVVIRAGARNAAVAS